MKVRGLKRANSLHVHSWSTSAATTSDEAPSKVLTQHEKIELEVEKNYTIPKTVQPNPDLC